MADLPIIFSAPMVRALPAGRKTQTRRALSRQWIVLGSRWGKNAPWAGLDFDKATVGRLSGMGFPDAHLRVPWVHPEDAARGMVWEDDQCIYRVRPPYEVGDRLWVREACRAEELSRPQTSRAATRLERQNLGRTSVIVCDELDGADGVRYIADGAWIKIENTPAAAEAWSCLFDYHGRGEDRCGHLVPSIHMPRWASRLTLIVTDVRVQRLQDISEEDARAEGASFHDGHGVGHSGWRHDDRDVHANARSSFARLWNSLYGPDAWTTNPWVAAISFDVHHGNIDALPNPIRLGEGESAHDHR